MNFLHKEFDLAADDVVEVTLDHAAMCSCSTRLTFRHTAAGSSTATMGVRHDLAFSHRGAAARPLAPRD